MISAAGERRAPGAETGAWWRRSSLSPSGFRKMARQVVRFARCPAATCGGHDGFGDPLKSPGRIDGISSERQHHHGPKPQLRCPALRRMAMNSARRSSWPGITSRHAGDSGSAGAPPYLGTSWIEVCTSVGSKWVPLDAASSDPTPATGEGHLVERCPDAVERAGRPRSRAASCRSQPWIQGRAGGCQVSVLVRLVRKATSLSTSASLRPRACSSADLFGSGLPPLAM